MLTRQPSAGKVMPPSNTDPALLPAHILSAAIGARQVSPVDVVDRLLERIGAGDAKLHAFVEVYAAEARLAAEAADKAIRSGHAVGPLHGSSPTLRIQARERRLAQLRVHAHQSAPEPEREIIVQRQSGDARRCYRLGKSMSLM